MGRAGFGAHRQLRLTRQAPLAQAEGGGGGDLWAMGGGGGEQLMESCLVVSMQSSQ